MAPPLIFALLLVTSCWGVQDWSSRQWNKKLAPVTNFQLSHQGKRLLHLGDRLNEYGHFQPYPNSIHINFTVFGREFYYELQVQSHIFGPDATVTVHGSNETTSPPRVTSYAATVGKGWVVATITTNEMLHATVVTENEVYEVNPVYFHRRDLKASHFSLLEQRATHGMVAFKHSDVNFTDYKCGVQSKMDESIQLSSPTSRHLLQQQPARFTDCYPGDTTTRRLYVGFAADLGFGRQASGGSLDPTAIQAFINQIVTTANQVYYPQLNMVISIGKSIIMTTSSTQYPWNYDRITKACPVIQDALPAFASWRSSVKSQTGMDQGLWHLLTDCFPPAGFVGLAFPGEVCDTQFGAGIGSFNPTTWLTSAHEMGHGIGAAHAFELGETVTGGIMDYGDGKYQGIYQFHPIYNRPEVCGNLTRILNSYSKCTSCVTQAHCFGPFTAVCGNGLVEPGEQCDGNTATNNCCNPVTCQINPGSECTGGECCNNCKILPTTSTCGSGTGYCSNGTCITTLCASYGLGFSQCPIQGQASTCTLRCYLGGACSNMAGWQDQNHQPLNMNLEDGSICQRSATSISRCSKGSCVVAATSGGTWSPSSWGPCTATCGTGTQSRSVSCLDVNSNVIANSNCDASSQPVTSQACPNLPACVTYVWKNNWASSLCSNDCGGGTQTQTPSCQVQSSGQVVSASFCDPSAEPALSRACNTGACPVSWATTGWGPCSTSCGTGVQTRSVTCQQTQNGVASTIANANCPSPAPVGQQQCNTQACASYQWSWTSWGTCNANCGTGSQSRTVTCRDANSAIVSNSLCSGSTPPTSQSCNTGACQTYTWTTSDWAPCSADCGIGQQQRTAQCVAGSQVVSNTLCVTSQPALVQNCNTFSCPNYQWNPQNWGPCSVSCGGGTTTRSVPCQNFAVSPVVTVQDAMCTTPKPDTSQTCNAQACVTWNWTTGDWDTCTETCGGGTQTRTVNCIRVNTGNVVANSKCSTPQPAATRNCNTQSCNPTYVWKAGGWLSCSRKCGTGTRVQTVTCQSKLTGQIVGNKNCDPTTEPPTTSDCNTQNCPGVWYVDSPGPCSQSCGGGTATRTVYCGDAGNPSLTTPGMCSGTKPSATVTCNSFACPAWTAADWMGCSSTCGTGSQTRSVICLNFDGTEAGSTLECISSMPATSQTCASTPCPTWQADEWSSCSTLCGGGSQSLSLTCRLPQDQGGVESNASLCSQIPNLEQPCGLDVCSDYYFSLTNLSPCSVSCGGGTQTGDVACFDPITRNQTNISLCGGTPPNTTVACNLTPCPIYGWSVMSEWTPCTAPCGGGWQTRSISCVDTTKNAVVADTFCSGLSSPETNQSCNTALDDNCGTFNRGTCRNYTGGYGWCKCRLGYYGDNCTFSPQISNVQMDIAQFSEGIPLGERVQIQWDTQGAMPYLAILLDKGDWKYPMYLDTEVINNQSLATQSPTYLWKISQTLPLGNDYQILVFFSPSVFGVSATFALADPCDYVSCGMYGSCVYMQGYCECVEGWSGANCQLSPCAAARCNPLTANCSDYGLGAGTCQCAPGWTGDRCYVPDSCTFSCSNGGLVTGGLSSSPSEACANLACSCYNFFGGSKCETCNVKCNNGGVPDPDCLICQCGAGTGWMGHDCSCQYYIIGVHVKTQYTDLDWLQSSQDVGTFKQTFAQDMALALSIDSSRILVQEILADNIVYEDDYLGVQVLFYLTENCVTTVVAQGNIYKAPTVTTKHYEPNPALHKLLAASTSPSNGTNPELDSLVALIRSMYGDIDTILYRGYITGKINSAQDLSVLDPFGQQKPIPVSSSSTPWINTYFWVIIIIVVVVLAAVGFGIWKYKQSHGYGRPQSDIDVEPTTLKSATNVREIFRSGTLDASGHRPQSPTSPTSATEMTPSLPEGWTKVFEEKTNTYYYYNTKTGESRWEIPHHPA